MLLPSAGKKAANAAAAAKPSRQHGKQRKAG